MGPINNSSRKVTNSKKSIKIVARNSNITNEELGSKRQLQLRNRCIDLTGPQTNKFRKSRSCKSSRNLSPVPDKNPSLTTYSSNMEHLKTLSIKSSSTLSRNKYKGLHSSRVSRNNPLRNSFPSESFLSTVESEGLQDENLDYEADSDRSPVRSENIPNKSHIRNNVSNGFNNILNSSYDSSATEDTPSHRSDMLPYYPHMDKAEDGRQNDYLRYTPELLSNKILLDSSSSSGYSGNSHKDDMDEDDLSSGSEEFDMTNEDENRLLECDGETSLIESEPRPEDVRSQSSSKGKDQSEEVENCEWENIQPVFKDSRITMKGKNIVIKAPNTHVTTNSRRSKYRPWDGHYHPYKNNVTLFLRDIGYDPLPECTLDQYSECSSDIGDSASMIRISSETIKPSTSFKVTVGLNQERKCEQVNKFSQPFKVPLPPIKRPPSRPKRPGSSTSNTNTSPSSSLTDFSDNYMRENYIAQSKTRRKKLIESPKEDDVISIVASSIGQLDYVEQDLADFTSEKIQWSSMSDLTEPLNNRSFIENWVSSQHIMPPPEDSVPKKEPSEEDNNSKRIIGSMVNFNDVNPFFHGLCYNYYFDENCPSKSCRRVHVVRQARFIEKCKNMSTNELQSIYNFTLRFHLLFSEMYPVFLKGFAFHKMQKSLITCIDHFFDLKEIVKISPAIEKVVQALEETGLTYLEAIEKISYSVGFMRHPELADILLDLTTQKPKIYENWDTIKRICRAKDYISPRTAERIISKVLTGPINMDKNICLDIYNVIIKNESTDLSKVNLELITALKTLAQFGSNNTNNNNNNNNRTLNNLIDENLLKERQIFEQLANPNEESQKQIDVLASSDNDERLVYCPFKESRNTDRRFEQHCSPSRSSSRSSTSSGRFAIEQDVDNRDNYQYVPQAVGAAVTPEQSIPSLVPNYTPLILADTSLPPPPINVPVRNQSSTTLVDVNLCPERPIFGKFKYKKGFEFDECLHNLLPGGRDQVVMNESDIIKLNEIIKNGKGADFLQLLDQYRGPNTLQHFITMSLATLKDSDDRPYNALIDLIENIGNIKPTFKHDSFLKGVFEVIIFNLLFFLERKCHWMDARKLIETFCDWDSLISSKLLQQFAISKLTPMRRFIFLAKLLSRGKAFYMVYDILQSPDLHLLESPDRWPLFHSTAVDVEYRDGILTEFFKCAYYHSIEVVCDMYRKIFQFGDIWHFDAHSYFNPMLEDLLNKEKTSLLKHFCSDIDIFYKKMNRNILRALIIYLDSQLTVENKFKLYVMAAQKGIYQLYSGMEQLISVRTNMPNVELKLVLQFYMHKLSQLPIELNHDLHIKIDLPAGIPSSPAILQKCFRSIDDVNRSIKKILHECFGISTMNNSDKYIFVDISKEELKRVFRN